MANIRPEHFQFFFCAAEESTDRSTFIRDTSAHRTWSYYPGADADAVLGRIWDVAHMTVQDMRSASGLTQADFATHLCAPRRTVEDWCSGKRTPPSYVRLLAAESLGLIDRTVPATKGGSDMEKRYIVIDEIRNGDCDQRVYRDADSANSAADMLWYHLTPSERKHHRVYAVMVDETMLDPYEVEFYGLDDDRAWLFYSDPDDFPGAFDSDNI